MPGVSVYQLQCLIATVSAHLVTTGGLLALMFPGTLVCAESLKNSLFLPLLIQECGNNRVRSLVFVSR